VRRPPGDAPFDLLDPSEQRPAHVDQLDRHHPRLVLRTGRRLLDVTQPPVDGLDLVIVCRLPGDDLFVEAFQPSLDATGAEVLDAPAAEQQEPGEAAHHAEDGARVAHRCIATFVAPPSTGREARSATRRTAEPCSAAANSESANSAGVGGVPDVSDRFHMV
jgi:hypothetical protein